MLGGKAKFVSVEDFEGENAKGKTYHVANIILSDGLQSLELPLDTGLLPTAKTLTRGQDVSYGTNVKKKGYDFSIRVDSLHKV